MKIHDISQEVFSCEVYPGDDAPKKIETMRICRGEQYNLTSFSMCAHNGTHIDAPFHFIDEGKSIEQIPLEKTVGKCHVVCFNGIITPDRAKEIMEFARTKDSEASKRILLKGNAIITPESAEVYAREGVFLIGVESQSVGEMSNPINVHKILLEKEIVLLEGIRLTDVPVGTYFLCAAPLPLSGADGAPCRAILFEE